MPLERTPAEPSIARSLEPVPAAPVPERGARLLTVELRETDWHGANLDEIHVEESRLIRIDLGNATLTDVAVVDAVLDDPDLSNAVLRGGSLNRVRCTGGRLTGVQMAETALRDTVWRNVSAPLSTFRLAAFARTTFEGCDLREADFTEATFKAVRFHDCDLRGAVFAKARFEEGELRRCRLDGIEGVEGLRGASIDHEGAIGLAPDFAHALGIGILDQ